MAEDKKSTPAGSSLADALRRYVDAVVGATEVSRDRAERIVSDLAKRGESRAKEIQQAAKELAERSAQNQRDLVRLVQKEIRRQVEALGLATRDDVSELETRVDELAGPSARSGKKRAKASATPSSAKPVKRAAAAPRKPRPASKKQER